MAYLKLTSAQDDHAETWVPRFARFGYAAKGVTYILIALLALRAALGDGNAQNTSGALQSINEPGVGKILLAVIAAGLGAYALYKLYFAAANPEHAKASKRISAFFVAIFNGGFALEAARLALSMGDQNGGGNRAAHWTAVVMNQPLGRVAVAVAGAGTAIYGIGRIIKAIKARLDKQLRLGELSPGTRRAVVGAARIGIAARGIAFILVGVFLIQAARLANPGEAKDIGHSLRELQQQPFGSYMLGVVAAGLFLYGVYELVRAKYRNFEH